MKKKYYYGGHLPPFISFNVLDIQSLLSIPNTYVKINNTTIGYTSTRDETVDPPTGYTCIISTPNVKTFEVEVGDTTQLYNPKTASYAYDTLNGHDILLSKKATSDMMNMNVQWNPPTHDFDTYMYIYENGTEKTHLYYGSKIGGEIKIEYPTNSGNYYTMDYYGDYAGDEHHRENVSGKLISGATYKFSIKNQGGGGDGKIVEQDCTVEIYIGNNRHVYKPKTDFLGTWWHVATIQETSPNVWEVTPLTDSREVIV